MQMGWTRCVKRTKETEFEVLLMATESYDCRNVTSHAFRPWRNKNLSSAAEFSRLPCAPSHVPWNRWNSRCRKKSLNLLETRREYGRELAFPARRCTMRRENTGRSTKQDASSQKTDRSSWASRNFSISTRAHAPTGRPRVKEFRLRRDPIFFENSVDSMSDNPSNRMDPKMFDVESILREFYSPRVLYAHKGHGSTLEESDRRFFI